MNNHKEQHASPSEGVTQPPNKSSQPDAVLKPTPYKIVSVKDAQDHPGAATKSAKQQLGNNYIPMLNTTDRSVDKE